MTKIRIQLGTREGNTHWCAQDRIFVSGDDGSEVEISEIVRAHKLTSEVGKARMVTLELFAAGQINSDGTSISAERAPDEDDQ